MSPHDCLVATDSEGMVYFFAYSSDRKFDVCFKKQYASSSQTNLKKVEPTPVTAIAFDPVDKLLVIGDVFGNVELWDCKGLIEKIEKNSSAVKDKFGKKKMQGISEQSNFKAS